MFSLNSNYFKLEAPRGVFLKYDPEKGKNCQVLYLDPDCNDKSVFIDSDNPVRYSAECTAYRILNSALICTGTLFVVNKRRINFDPRYFYVRETEEFDQPECVNKTGIGGVFIYKDVDCNLLVTPSTKVLSQLVVTE